MHKTFLSLTLFNNSPIEELLSPWQINQKVIKVDKDILKDNKTIVCVQMNIVIIVIIV